jgi:superfamily II DNA/RNA helicase
MPYSIYSYTRNLGHFMNLDIGVLKKGTSLIFCKYRSEVDKRTKLLKAQGYIVLSCIGGEASKFVEELKLHPHIDFIVATSVVSHGVNLPNISRIYFTYKVDNIDFYLQMIGRGGRDGSRFDIHTFNRDYFPKGLLFIGLLKVYLKSFRNRMISLLYYFNGSRRYNYT